MQVQYISLHSTEISEDDKQFKFNIQMAIVAQAVVVNEKCHIHQRYSF